MFRSNTTLRSVDRIYCSLSGSRFGRMRTTFSVDSATVDSCACRPGTINTPMRPRPTTTFGFMTVPSSSQQCEPFGVWHQLQQTVYPSGAPEADGSTTADCSPSREEDCLTVRWRDLPPP